MTHWGQKTGGLYPPPPLSFCLSLSSSSFMYSRLFEYLEPRENKGPNVEVDLSSQDFSLLSHLDLDPESSLPEPPALTLHLSKSYIFQGS